MLSAALLQILIIVCSCSIERLSATNQTGTWWEQTHYVQTVDSRPFVHWFSLLCQTARSLSSWIRQTLMIFQMLMKICTAQFQSWLALWNKWTLQRNSDAQRGLMEYLPDRTVKTRGWKRSCHVVVVSGCKEWMDARGGLEWDYIRLCECMCWSAEDF